MGHSRCEEWQSYLGIARYLSGPSVAVVVNSRPCLLSVVVMTRDVPHAMFGNTIGLRTVA